MFSPLEMQKAEATEDKDTDLSGVPILQLPCGSVEGLGLWDGPKPRCCTRLGEPRVGHPGTRPWG